MKTCCGTPSSRTAMSSCWMFLMKRLLLSVAVKRTFVRSVSTRSTSSSSMVSSGLCAGFCCCCCAAGCCCCCCCCARARHGRGGGRRQRQRQHPHESVIAKHLHFLIMSLSAV
ncbi:MAG TPA: hypothetical protein VM936_06040 [Pyrinomonadaceae bacterium]|nr:hypothetical protein [Pyrinomonadaceae bacterium]